MVVELAPPPPAAAPPAPDRRGAAGAVLPRRRRAPRRTTISIRAAGRPVRRAGDLRAALVAPGRPAPGHGPRWSSDGDTLRRVLAGLRAL
jgi:hypothetical protein